MITFLTIIIAFGCLLLMTIILIQDPKTGRFNSNITSSKFTGLINRRKSSLLLENLTWTIASVLFILCIITVVIS